MLGFFARTGAHVLVDGQFGSTGKGVLAAFLAAEAIRMEADFTTVLSNAGPNSGHTFYHGDEKHVLKQLPTFAVASHLLGKTIPVYLTAGAVIDPAILKVEAQKYPDIPIYVHNNAAVITQEDKDSEHSGTVQQVAGTRSGTGAAIARKVLRDPNAIFRNYFDSFPPNVYAYDGVIHGWTQHRFFIEVSQGFSLGLNDARFYPKVTSRECTVSQALSDARLPPQAVAKTYMVARTYPIRVGNHEGFSSGGHYPDQEETTWEAIGQTPELTTVTQRIRRVFTFSRQQMFEAIWANAPDYLFLNFMNYLTKEQEHDMMVMIDSLHRDAPLPFHTLYGYGPTSKDVVR